MDIEKIEEEQILQVRVLALQMLKEKLSRELEETTRDLELLNADLEKTYDMIDHPEKYRGD